MEESKPFYGTVIGVPVGRVSGLITTCKLWGKDWLHVEGIEEYFVDPKGVEVIHKERSPEPTSAKVADVIDPAWRQTSADAPITNEFEEDEDLSPTGLIEPVGQDGPQPSSVDVTFQEIHSAQFEPEKPTLTEDCDNCRAGGRLRRNPDFDDNNCSPTCRNNLANIPF